MAVARTPIGTFVGGLSPLTAVQLSTITISECLKRSGAVFECAAFCTTEYVDLLTELRIFDIPPTGISPKEVDEVILGNVVSANLGQAVATQAASKAGYIT